MATMANFDMKQMAPMDAKEFNMPLKLKTDGINPVSSVTVFRIFSSVFVFSGINENGIENGTE
jgi:hypothetical protein